MLLRLGGRASKGTSVSSVPIITPQLRRIHAPAVLRGKEAWLMWRAEQYPGDKKPRRMPYYANGGRRKSHNGSTTDRASLTSFVAARDAAMRMGYDGVGFAPLPGMDTAALDFDNCVGPNGELPKEVRDIIGCTYAEYSPSGKGVRAFFLGDLGNHKSPTTPTDFGFEVFSTSGYVTVTGNALPFVELLGLEDTVAHVNEKVRALCDRKFGADRQPPAGVSDDPFAGHEPKLGLTIDRMEDLLRVLDPDMSRDQWIRVGMALHHECDGDDTGFTLWNEWSSNGGKYPSEESLTEQWSSFDRPKAAGRRQITMATVIRMAKEATAEASRQPATVEELKDAAAEVRSEDPSTVETSSDFSGKFKIIGAGALSRRPPPEWLIKNVLPRADVIVLYGASGSGKSFVAMDMGGAIARGIDWRENKTSKGRVLIIAAEGGSGVGKRLKAYCLHHEINVNDINIGVITAAPNFLQKEDIIEVVTSVKNAGGFDLIITDTFAQVTPGANENAGEDMGLALANAKALREATGAVVMLIHHAGKDTSKGSRGWSGIKAAADAEIEVSRYDNGGRDIKISKMKDGDDGLAWGFRLDIITVSTDMDGEDVTSCVVIETDRPQPQEDSGALRSNVKPMTPMESVVFDFACAYDKNVLSVNKAEFAEECIATLDGPAEGRDARRPNVMTAIDGLLRRSDAPFKTYKGADNTLIFTVS